MRLSMDLNKSDKELKKGFLEILKNAKEAMYRRQVVKPGVSEGRTTRKDREYDPWIIYDLHINKGLSVPEIARTMKGKSGNTAHKNNRPAPDKGVNRAYKKAVKMIQGASAEFKSWFPDQP